ncbi:protein NEGATIVE REGULATOR OF RESISTANCE-like [Andrographis paniculata]|uniref:protein NEGATIVE REGULATOR OF RESISTANCE-like n=1 Tax=Andrographis paniculata TaxID=175694 RepID=UPI0021E71CE2|nr:protein NEGATIVE REGULATOR OF RESISTANCE-like [Andrographis paniculata]
MGKTKRLSDGETANGKRRKAAADGGKVAGPPGDEEVEEFFERVKRVHVALKYFEKRNADDGRESTPSSSPRPPWRPLFQPEDFAPEKPDRSPFAGLDLNSDPATDVSDSA